MYAETYIKLIICACSVAKTRHIYHIHTSNPVPHDAFTFYSCRGSDAQSTTTLRCFERFRSLGSHMVIFARKIQLHALRYLTRIFATIRAVL